jgi:hypothetical protein
VVDNEGMGRKSSKRCCIFPKQRAFGESSIDSSDYDHDHDDQEGNDDDSGAGKHRKIARKKNQGASANEKLKKGRKTPDHLRFHA